jgi:ABC-type lipoprotein release transport system permease subunit
MNFFAILKRDLLFYWRNNCGTLLLAMVCCAVLTGAMLVGDSVRSSLLRLSRMRLGRAEFTCSTGDRFFRQQLAGELAEASDTKVAAVLALRGILESADGSVRINQVNIYGVDDTFWNLAPAEPLPAENRPVDGAALLSRSVQDRLGALESELLLRVESLTLLSKDLIFSVDQTRTQAWPIQIAGTVPDEAMGRFSLQSRQDVPLNVFVPIGWLAEKTGRAEKANLLIIPTGGPQQDYEAMVKQSAQLSDYGLELHFIEPQQVFELRSARIFMEDSLAASATNAGKGAYGIFTYFVNELRLGEKSVPYSMVTAESLNGPLPDLDQNEMAVNEWLADELEIEIGDDIQLTYFQITPTRELIEQTTSFHLRRVVPMMGHFADPTLMPDFPGLADAENCRDWDPGIPIDLDKIQPRDETYWNRYRGTPKAFISLDTAREIWSNRFGSLTAIRYPAAQNSEAELRAALLETIDPAAMGFEFRNVRTDAHTSAAGSTDFSGLFGGLSMFLIVSAAILLSLVFIFYVESRGEQVGLLLAVGWGWLRIFYLFMIQGAVLAILGCLAGAAVSVLYAKGLIVLLNATFWTKALADLQLVYDASLSSLVLGISASFLICLFAVQAALFRRIRKPVHQLLTGTDEPYTSTRKAASQLNLWIGLVCLAGAFLLPLQSALRDSQTASFFLTGILLLAAVLFLSAHGLKWLRAGSASFARSLPGLAVKNIPRRTGRSLAVLITLACGVFVVIGVGANYKQIGEEVHRRNSGTGGFALIAQSTIPMTERPTLAQVRQNESVPPILPDAVVPLRVYQNDDASCLNLNRALQPTLLGVNPELLAQKDAFDFQQSIEDEDEVSPWQALHQDLGEDVIPAVGDSPTVTWGLRKKLGDTLDYQDENGRTVRLQIVGILKSSILQGRLLISEQNFVNHFPSVDGYQLFLIDADREDLAAQSGQLTQQYRDFGLEIMPAAQQLARFQEVENTYLAIFLVLGGLGLILGSAGLGLVLVLNVLDRKGEIAMMQAVGFQKPELTGMLFLEHALLLAAGVLGGVVPALLAVWPVIRTQGGDFPYAIIICTVFALLISGAVWVRIAIGGVLKLNFLETLRNQ